jgi:hypothetical protein
LIDFAEFPALLHECEISTYHDIVKDFKKKIYAPYPEILPRVGETGAGGKGTC